MTNLSELDFENIGSWPQTTKYMIVAVVFLLVLAIGYYIDTQQQRRVLTTMQTKEFELKEKLRVLHSQAANIEEYRQQMVELEKRLTTLLQKLPSATEMPDLLEDISRTGASTGLAFQSIQPQEEKDMGFYTELPIDIKVMGDYHQMGQFVSQISNLSRIVTLRDFTLHVGKETGLELNIMAKTYHYADEEDFDETPLDEEAS